MLPGAKTTFSVRFPDGIEDDVVYLVVLAVDLVVVIDGLHARHAAVGVVVQRVLELALLGGEFLDDLVGRGGGRSQVHGAEALVHRHGRETVLLLRDRRRCDQCGRQQYGTPPIWKTHHSLLNKLAVNPVTREHSKAFAIYHVRRMYTGEGWHDNQVGLSAEDTAHFCCVREQINRLRFFMQDWYQIPALILTMLLLPAFGRLYLRSRDTRTLLWFLAFVLTVARMLLLYPWGTWDFNDGTHPWHAAIGQACALLSSALFLGSLSPLRFRIGKVSILYVVPFIGPMLVYAIFSYGVFHNVAPQGPVFLLFPALCLAATVAGLFWARAEGGVTCDRWPRWPASSSEAWPYGRAGARICRVRWCLPKPAITWLRLC